MASLSKPTSVSIIGFGRFGRLLASILEGDFELLIYDSANGAPGKSIKNDKPHADELNADKTNSDTIGVGTPGERASNQGKFVDLEQALEADVIFYCVPISSFEDVIKEHAKYLGAKAKRQTVVDVLSVKMHARRVLEEHLPASVQALLTHPMFGPDTVKKQGLAGLRIVMNPFRISDEDYKFWKEYFEGKKLNVIELSSEEHDAMAAESQGLAHFVGRVLEDFGMESTPIDTLGAQKLHEVKDLASNDTWQLFVDLQTRNPYTRAMRIRLADAQTKIFNQLIPNRLNQEKLIVGIQGGKGSFNEEAARFYLNKIGERNFELRYLYTTENVLKALHEGEVDRGQFAMHNSLGGIVTESVTAMANYRFNIVEEFAIKIAHSLMKYAGSDFAKIDTVMAHPQVFAQCKSNLKAKYPQLKQVSGEGELIDHAKVAEVLSAGGLPTNIAVMGSRVLAQIHGLDTVENDLQDLESNFTSFLWVERPAPVGISRSA